jgi:hypothetical protein
MVSIIAAWLIFNGLFLTFLYIQYLDVERAETGDRRMGFNRRQFSYGASVPERRSGNDRRLSYNG